MLLSGNHEYEPGFINDISGHDRSRRITSKMKYMIILTNKNTQVLIVRKNFQICLPNSTKQSTIIAKPERLSPIAAKSTSANKLLIELLIDDVLVMGVVVVVVYMVVVGVKVVVSLLGKRVELYLTRY